MNATTGRAIARALAALLLLPALACAAPATPRKSTAAPPPAAPAPAAKAPPALSAGTVEELRQLIDSHQLTELRTTYNGSYGASLLFLSDKLTYYVTLFHDKEIWRVVYTDSIVEAENVYRSFGAQTEKLAQVDIDALRLQAGKRYTDKLVAANEERLRSLQQDAARQQQQAQQVATLQQQAQQQASSLTGELHNSSSQLETVQRRIRALELQQANPELALPTPAPSTTATPVAATASPPGN